MMQRRKLILHDRILLRLEFKLFASIESDQLVPAAAPDRSGELGLFIAPGGEFCFGDIGTAIEGALGLPTGAITSALTPLTGAFDSVLAIGDGALSVATAVGAAGSVLPAGAPAGALPAAGAAGAAAAAFFPALATAAGAAAGL